MYKLNAHVATVREAVSVNHEGSSLGLATDERLYRTGHECLTKHYDLGLDQPVDIAYTPYPGVVVGFH